MKSQRDLFAILFLILGIILSTSCVSKKYTKKGIEYEQMGLKTEAAEYYYHALVKKHDNIEAKLGLKRTGQVVLDERLARFNEAYNSGNNSLSVEEYLKAQNYYNALAKLEVDLNFPSQYQQYYEDAKNVYLEEQYIQATQLLEKNKFKEAENILRNILALNANYRDSKEKLEIAICEPKYLNVILLMETKKYRTAYSRILDLQNYAATYKDVVDLKNECLEKGSVSIMIKPVKSNTANKAVAESVKLSIIRTLQNLNNPFLKVLDNEEKPTASQTMILDCEIQSLEYSSGKLTKTETKGWLRKVLVNKETGEKKTEYNKVVYYVYQQNRKLNFSINYKLTDQRNGQVLTGNSDTFTAFDALKYATFDGEHKNLVQGYWKNKISLFNNKEDRIDDNWTSNQEIQNLLNAKKTIKEYNTLLKEVKDASVKMIINDIEKIFENE